VSAVGHGALMDRVYRRQRHIYDLTRKYYLFGRDALIDSLELEAGARVLEVGCGTARNLIRIAGKYPGVKLYGLDASAQMLATAQRSLAHAGLATRVRLVEAYAENLSPGLFGEKEPFDAIIFSYSLSMIPDWRQALRAAATALAPAGTMHIVDFGDLRGLGRLIEAMLRMWLGLFHVAPRVELLETLQNNPSTATRLTLLLGRYAFLLSCRAEDLHCCRWVTDSA
jgi:S-adenosylmethionine-diacylgycerolhomoserine-N-methlytransferase